MALYRLLLRLDRQQVMPVVISLTGRGVLGSRFEEAGIQVIPLHAGGLGRIQTFPRLVRELRTLRPNVVQTWMYHADLLGGVAARLSRRPPVVWGLRSALQHPRDAGPVTRYVIAACAVASRWIPDRTVSVSESGRRSHSSWGYPADKMLVIPNGFDVERFRPDAELRKDFRRELGLSEDALVIANVGRVHPHKDHSTLMAAAAQISRSDWDIHLILAGEGTNESAGWMSHAFRRDRLHLLGARHDVQRILNGSDLYCSSSIAEAFPNAVGEAMACGLPCVVTDVGDSADLVGDTGFVVPSGDPSALAAGLEALLKSSADERRRLGLKARERIELNYDIEQIADRYESLYMELTS